MSTTTSQNIGLFPLCMQSNSPLPGAPTFKVSVLVNAPTGNATGTVHIAQAVTPPGGNINVEVTGTYSQLLGGSGHVLSLTGQYMVACPPPALCIMTKKFLCSIFISADGKSGKGFFHWGEQAMNEVAMTTVACF